MDTILGMAKELTIDEMMEIIIAHEKAELEVDLEATMDTLVPNPHYELPVQGWSIDGRDAVYELYSRILPGADKWNISAEARQYLYGENTVAREAYVSFDNLEGKRVTCLYHAKIILDPELHKIAGERLYMGNLFAELMAHDIGEGFEKVPGVSRIVDVAPNIAEHDAIRDAAARGISIVRP